jgi:hypothetical protein
VTGATLVSSNSSLEPASANGCPSASAYGGDETFDEVLAVRLDIEPGLHTIRSSGTRADGGELSVSLAVTVEARDLGDGRLPSTGTRSLSWWWSLALLGMGSVVSVAARRRSDRRVPSRSGLGRSALGSTMVPGDPEPDQARRRW